MASKNHEGLKRILLLGFVAISVLLIGLIWLDGLNGHSEATPSYYRDSFQMDPNIYLTITAEAIEFERSLNGTPAPTREGTHQGGGGQGRGNSHDAAAPTPTGTAAP